MKNLLISYSLCTLIIISLLTGCDKPTLPIVTSTIISNISGITAKGGGNITSDGGSAILGRGVCWSTSVDPTIAGSKTSDGTGTGEFSSNITGLSESSTYHVRAYATNAEGTAYGEDLSFATLGKPTLSTTIISGITSISGIGGGNISSDGGATVTERGICWSTAANPTISDAKATGGTGTGIFVCNLTGLSGNTTYFVRAYATNNVGTGYGDQVSFTTMPPVPILTTVDISALLSHSCLSGGIISSDAGYPITEKGVCYSTSPNPTIANSRTSDGTGSGTFSSTIKSLSQNTTYYARAFAITAAGTGYGNEVTFKTLVSPVLFNTGLTYGSVTDIDGNVYKTITLDTQVWMAENLKTTKYQNGDIIATTTLPGADISGESTPRYQWIFDANESNLSSYGRLYTWYVVTDSRNICPSGWHVSTDAEWVTLSDFLGGFSVAGGKIKETGLTHWFNPNTGATNETGFTALPGGYRIPFGTFYGIGLNCILWTSSQFSTTDGYIRGIDWNIAGAVRAANTKSFGFSVRCVKD